MKPIDSIPIVVEESDYQSLQRYAQGGPGAEAAFATLVARYLPLVYSVAVRRVGDRHLAEDVAQAVFLVLAKKAARFNERTILSNWLFCTTRYAAANALKTRARRRHHEQKHQAMTAANVTAEEMSDDDDDATFDWDAIAPLLDGALGALGRRDREAVLLKYIEGRSHRDVGLAMGISEEAARKRISRAIERLRGLFGRGGLTVSVAAVVAMLATQASAVGAPAGLAGTITSAAVAGGTGGGVAALAALGKGAGSIVTWMKSKVAIALLTMGITGAAAAGAIAKWGLPASARPVAQLQSAKPQAAVPAPQVPAAPAAPQAEAKVLEGAIRTPSDTPADKAEVFIVVRESKETRQARMEWQAAMMANPRNGLPAPKPADTVDVYSQQWPAGTFDTEAEGYFTFPAPPEGMQWMLVARHPTGYAELSQDDFAKSKGLIRLQAWGAVEGQLLVGDKPQANVKVMLARTGSADDWVAMQVRHSRETRTDAGGRYSFKDVAPGLSWLSRSQLPKMFRIDLHTLIDVKPGVTLQTQMGGKGRPVIGRAAATPTNEPDTKISWASRGGQRAEGMLGRADRPGMKLPDGWERMSHDEQIRWTHEWETNTPEGRLCLERQWGEGFDINPDGTFRIEDVKPGKYNAQLRILVTENHFGLDLVQSSIDFEVPPLPEGKERIDEPLDLGTIQIKTLTRLRTGKPAPDFTAKGLDGTPIKLSDYRGKTVVLKWWWNWSEMETEAAAMNRAYERISKEPDVVLITLGMDNEIATAKKRVADWKLGGIHGWAGPDYTKVMPQEYFGSPSTLCIIGPDGNVRAKSLMAQEADTEVAKVLLER